MSKIFYLIFILFITQTCCAEQNLFKQKVNRYAKDVALGKQTGVTSFIVVQNNQPLVTSYAPDYSETSKHDLRSVTKSITALLIGRAVDEKLLPNEKVLIKSLLNTSPSTTSAFNQIRINDLLTMRTGLACDDWVPSSLGNEDKMYQEKNWSDFFLSLPQSHEVGSHFSYCTGGAILLGDILNNKLHGKLQQWADQRLFSKLDIVDYRWSKTPYGEIDTGGHIYMKSADLIKIGQLLLNQGRYNNQQVVPTSWVEKLFTAQTKVYERPYFYSYWWWLNTKAQDEKNLKTQYIFAWGNGGQYLFIIPKHQVVIVFTGLNFNSRAMLKPQLKVKEWLKILE
jgi:CubicO group peptidase (beta-lactamase class C family)